MIGAQDGLSPPVTLQSGARTCAGSSLTRGQDSGLSPWLAHGALEPAKETPASCSPLTCPLRKLASEKGPPPNRW